MATSDLDMLVDMGFEKERAQIGLSRGGNLQGAIDWLEQNQEKSLEEIKQASTATAADDEDGPALQPGEEAKSLVCNECGKKFRSHAQAEFHASKTEHTDFSESTDEIAPLTEAEKAEKLEALRARAAARTAGAAEVDKAELKRNEEIRRKATREQSDRKEELKRQEQMKEVEKKRREKQADVEAKRRIQQKIAEDKEQRKLKQERERAARLGQPAPAAPAETAQSSTPAAPAAASTSKPASAYTEARLRLQTDQGPVQKNFPVETTLFEVAHAVSEEKGIEVSSFLQNFPKKIFDAEDFGMTLKEAGLVPSAALIVKEA